MELPREEMLKLEYEGELVGIYNAFIALNLAFNRQDGTCTEEDLYRESPKLLAAFRQFFEAFTGAPFAEAAYVAWCTRRRLANPTFDSKMLARDTVDHAALWAKLGSCLERVDQHCAAFIPQVQDPSPASVTQLQTSLRTLDSTIRALQKYPASWAPALFLIATAQRLDSLGATPFSQAEVEKLISNVELLKGEVNLARG
jgi:hypothetical protein